MRFFEIVVSGAALISSAFAVTIDTYPTSGVEAGKSYTITYSPKDQPATFILRKGLSTDLTTIATIGTGQGGSFTWSVPSNLPNGADYALQVTQGTEINYSGQFGLTGGSASALPSSGASTSTVVVTSRTTQGSTVVVTRSTSAASVSIVPSAGANSTVSTATLSRTPSASASRPASTTGGSPPESTGAAAMLSASPFAAIFGAIAAFAYLA